MANVVSRDIRSVTGKNLAHIETVTGLDPWRTNSTKVTESVPDAEVSEVDMWRLPLLCQYLFQRMEMETNLEDTKNISSLIYSGGRMCENSL